MDRTNLTHKLQAWGQQLEHVRQHLTASPALPQMPIAAMFDELSSVEAELSAAQEELSQQAETLATGQQATEAARQRYQELFEFAPDGYLVLDADGAIQEANRAAADLLQTPQDWLLRKPLAVFIASGDRRTFRTNLARLRQGKDVHAWEAQIQPQHGPPWPALFSIVPARDAYGMVLGVRCIFRDFTERRRTEEALSRYACRLEILHTIDQAIRLAQSLEATAEAALRQMQAIVPCWGAGVTLFDWEAGQAVRLAIVGRGKLPALAEKRVSLEAIGEEDLAALRAGRVHVVEDILDLSAPPPAMQVLQQAGVRSYFRVPLFMQETLLGALNLWDDHPNAFMPEQVEIACEVSDLLAVALRQAQLREQVERHAGELEQHVRERTAQLEATIKELEAFSYAVAHDLRAPLRAIHSFSEILLEEYAPRLDGEAQGYLQRVSRNALHMGRLIDTLLEFSGLSRQPMAKETVAPAALVQQLLDELRPVYEHRQVEITMGELPTCQADPVLFKQVWANLLDNALKFTRRRPVARIEVGWHDREGEGVYFVRDNGVGFDQQYADKLFGVFHRLHRAEDYEGAGVGLALTQRIVQRHGGHIWAEGEVEQGATFSFTLGV
jgi:PAS domain S-box-containing protein